jgi:hypothetical protein
MTIVVGLRRVLLIDDRLEHLPCLVSHDEDDAFEPAVRVGDAPPLDRAKQARTIRNVQRVISAVLPSGVA